MTQDLKPRIRKVIADVLGIATASITDDAGAESIDAWDSMNHLHIIVALEGEFAVSLDPDRAVEMTSVRAIEENLLALSAR